MTTAAMYARDIAKAAEIAASKTPNTTAADRLAALAIMAKNCTGDTLTVSLDDFVLLAEYYPD